MVMSVERDFRAWGNVPFFSEDRLVAVIAPRGRFSRMLHLMGAVAAIAIGVLLWIEVWRAETPTLSMLSGAAAVGLFAFGMHLIERSSGRAKRRIS